MRAASHLEKCRSCGGFHGALMMIEDYLPESCRPPELTEALALAAGSLQTVSVNCNGCPECLPVQALKAVRGMVD